MLNLQCHCGDVSLVVNQLPPQLTSCNCSICRRLSALWGYYAEKDVVIRASDHALKSDTWDKEEILFYHCTTCGCTTHYASHNAKGEAMIAINTRLAKPNEIESIPVRHFDGAKTWQFLD